MLPFQFQDIDHLAKLTSISTAPNGLAQERAGQVLFAHDFLRLPISGFPRRAQVGPTLQAATLDAQVERRRAERAAEAAAARADASAREGATLRARLAALLDAELRREPGAADAAAALTAELGRVLEFAG